MPQRRLEHYFKPLNTPFIPSRPNFLDLPRPIRTCVYKLIGLDDVFVDLNYNNLQVYPHGTYPESLESRKIDARVYCCLRRLSTVSNEIWEFEGGSTGSDPGTSVWGRSYGVHQSMLLVSRQIHKEVVAITYAASVFRVCLGQPLGFTRLWSMSHNALSYLGSLTIRLDVSHCEVENDIWADALVPAYLDLSSACGIAIFDRWKSTLDILKRSITPGQLRLRVVFRAKTMDDAKTLINPMLQLPRLKDCGICAEVLGDDCWWISSAGTVQVPNILPRERLSQLFADTETSRLAQRTIRTLVNEQDSRPFRYLDLPKELRLEILRFTDMVRPDVVQWRPYKRKAYRWDCESCNEDGYERADTCACRFNPVMDYYEEELYTCCKSCGPQDRSGICYCSAQGQLWSSSCNCYHRHSLFSVSRQVRCECTLIYYTCNKIMVTPYNSRLWRLRGYDNLNPVAGISHMPRIELSLYLSSIAPQALQHIRWLEWMLPSSQQAYLAPQTPAWSEYVDTLLFIQSSMNLSALTFTINIAALGANPFYTSSRVRIALDEDALVWYKTIILPIRRLSEAGLKDFFVHIRWHDVSQKEMISRDKNLENEEIVAHENNLERAVMGENYDSAKRGKPEERMLQLFRKLENSRSRMSDS